MAQVLTPFLQGSLSSRSGGYLLRLPEGVTARSAITRDLVEAYGSEAHPDLVVLDPESQTIGVDDIRSTREFLATRPMGGGMKTLMVIAAHRMNGPAANAFLKSLEEPSKYCRIILATDRPWTLPATILSRCHKSYASVETEGLLHDEVVDLIEDHAFSEEQISGALSFCGDNPSVAAQVLRHDLQDWHRKAMSWIDDPKGRPTIPGKGKDAPSLETLFHLLRSGFMACLKDAAARPTWSPERADTALNILEKMSRGIQRPGLDAKTRLAATLSCLAYMEI